MWKKLKPQEKANLTIKAIEAGCLSAGEIADYCLAPRNAVIGVMRRNGIALPQSRASNTSARLVVGPKAKSPKPKAKAKPKAKVAKVDADSGALEEASHAPSPTKAKVELIGRSTIGEYKRGKQCNWIVGKTDGLNTPVCGREVEGGKKGWCPYHMSVGTVPMKGNIEKMRVPA